VIKPEDLQIGSSELRNQHSPTSSTHKLLSPKTQYDDPIEQLEAALIGLFETNPDALFDKIEEAVMSSAFRYCHRNQVQTAKLLGISRNIVRARLLKIGEIKAESESIA